MRAVIKWMGKASFEGVADSGHVIRMDGPPDHGGENAAARPMEAVLIGMGGCTAFDVVHILRKGRQDVSDCVAEIDAERAPVEPKVFTRIHIHFKVTGRNLDPERVKKAIELSATKYCSASIMLGKTAEISHDFEIADNS